MGVKSLSDYSVESPALPMCVLAFRFVDFFQNRDASKSTGIENRGRILYVWFPVKMQEDGG